MPMIAVTGAAMVLSTFPAERCGFSRSSASALRTKRMRAGLELAEVGPSFMSSAISFSRLSGTGLSSQAPWVRASVKRAPIASAASFS